MSEKPFPQNWRIGQDFDPNQHLMQLKGRDYLNVQSRLLWFIRDQRALIVAGLSQMPYIVRSELVEMDREHGWAHFKTYVRDVMGNEATMYGSESAKDFPDFAEKASTKSLGRALLALGYGTAFAPEMDEGNRVVDSPTTSRHEQQGAESVAAGATQAQLNVIANLCRELNYKLPDVQSADDAQRVIDRLRELKRERKAAEKSA